MASTNQQSDVESDDAVLTRERLASHVSQTDYDYKNTNNNEHEDDSAFESADMFAELGDNHLPWHRPSISADSSSRQCSASAEPGSSDVNELSRSVYETFSKREEVLQKSYADTRFYMTESYLDTEITRYELLLKEMRENSALKSLQDDQVKLDATAWDENSIAYSAEAIQNQKIAATKVTWLLKSLKASEDFHLKSNLVRSMFRQTNQFFNTLNDMEITFLLKKHMRELSKHTMIQKLRAQSLTEDKEFRSRTELIELANIKEIQNIELRNMKEFYVRMLKKESDGLNDHLDMLEKLYNILHRVYIDVMNLKIRGINDWLQYRQRNDKTTSDSIKRVHDQCNAEMRNDKDLEHRVEMDAVKSEAELERMKRQELFGDDSSIAVSSELVFSMNLSRRSKLAVMDDNSSIGTFVLYGQDEDDDLEAASAPRNEAFLKIVRKRAVSKKLMEDRSNILIQKIVKQREHAEHAYLETIRKRERDFLKASMKHYFTQELVLEDHIQELLRHEKHAIEAMQTHHKHELKSVMNTQAVMLKKLHETNVKDRQDHKKFKEAASELKIRQNDVMLTAHCFHEIRNVLASILCLGENLKEDPESIATIISEQNDICSYALETMNDMLSIAKLKEPSFVAQRSPILVRELFDATIRIQGRRANKDVQVITLLDDADLKIFSDKRLLLQLFVNLLSNASKFTAAGTIALWAARRTDKDSSNVVLGIVDTGSGFDLLRANKKSDESDLSTVTGFVDTHSEISANIAEYHTSGYMARNTGYGLYLASTVANALQSKLKVQSPVPTASGMPKLKPFPGSFFYLLQPELSDQHKMPKSKSVILKGEAVTERQNTTSRNVEIGETPKICDVSTARDVNECAREEAQKSIASEAQNRAQWHFQPQGHMRVLIVDDQKLLRQAMIIMIKKLVEKHDGLSVHIETACCAEEALRKQLQSNFDLISLDQYYDNIIISHTEALAPTDEYPNAQFCHGAAEDNKSQYVNLKNKEAFKLLPQDGNLVGTDVIQSLRTTASRPIVYSCTASDNVEEVVVMMKPYTLDKLEALLREHMSLFLTQQFVYLDGADIRKSDKLIMYQMNQIH